MRLKSLLVALPVLVSPVLSSTGTALAATYYVAPLGSAIPCTSDGSQACPWASLTAAFNSKKIVGGDTILLMDGDFGKLDQIKLAFDLPVVIQSQNASNAHIAGVTFSDTAKNITLRNLSVWHDDSDPDTGYLISAYPGSSYLTFDGLTIRSRQDSNNYIAWSLDRWASSAVTGFYVRGTYTTVRNSTLTGVKGGIYATGGNALVENNVIDGFAEDAMKGDGSGSTFRGNIVKNVVNVWPDYHNDGFQSVSSNSPVTDLSVVGNTIIEWTNDPGNALKGSLQGIGLYDGWYDNLLIQNNLVVTSHYHGISVYGTRGCKILNNTAVAMSGLPNTSPWIMVTAKKDGTPSQNVLAANNLAMAINVTPDPAFNIVALNNSVILDPAAVFTNLKTFDYRPLAASGFLDTGNAADAPAIDILGAARPFGAGPDRGAYEVGASSSTSTSGGTTTTTDGGTTTSTSGGTTSGGTTTTTDGGTTTSGGTTTASGGNVKGWAAKFLKPPKK